MMKKMFTTMIAAVTLPIISVYPVSASEQPCTDSKAEISFKGQLHQLDEVCEAVNRVTTFFGDLGFTSDKPINIVTADGVFNALPDGKVLQSYANFNAVTNRVMITNLDSPYTLLRTVWLKDPKDMKSGLVVTNEDWVSILTHELAHSVFQDLWEKNNPTHHKNGMFVPKGIHEYVAYVVQISTMDPKRRDEVLSQYDVGVFPYVERLNGIIHYYHPHEYGARSYKTHLENGGQWIKDFVNGKFVYDGPPI